ncbi:MAG: sugar phosphate isomerase/epimerase, partial [Pirellula sp.]|nr:sugar phosphate isomerase/epimerase [Pirellula sp.]
MQRECSKSTDTVQGLPAAPGATTGFGLQRRHFMGAAAAATALVASTVQIATGRGAATVETPKTIVPPEGKKLLLSCKLGMIAKKVGGKELSLVERLKMAAAAGFDGVDFDEAGAYTVEQAKAAVLESGVFCHNAINHAHWQDTLTNKDASVRAKGVSNIEHCIRVSHAIGGSGVLIVIGKGEDGTPEECDERAASEIRKLIPLAASLGQPILIENVWNKIH